MSSLLLVINTGSSSIKFSIFERGASDKLLCVTEGQIESIGSGASLKVKSLPHERKEVTQKVDAPDHASAINRIRTWISTEFPDADWKAIGHRVVHGGGEFNEAVEVTEQVLNKLKGFMPLDPLHQPLAISAIENCLSAFKGVRQFACFDTAFHSTQSELATKIPLPKIFSDKKIRRYGFHGLSYQYIGSLLKEFDPKIALGKVVVAHLGNGASLCGIENGISVATTMGFSVLDGLMMGTRPGSVDPGAILYMLKELRVTPSELEDILYRQSGLLGVSGISADVRTLLESKAKEAKEALELYIYRIVREIASIGAALGGIQAIIFTAGVGENSSEIRKQVLTKLSWLGIEIDEAANRNHSKKITLEYSKIEAFVFHTDENEMIARNIHSLA